MATKEQTIAELTKPANGWLYTPWAETTARRPLFLEQDVFVFEAAGSNLTLRVTEPGSRLVLGKDLLLAWDASVAAFTVTAYGRFMEFRATPAGTPHGWRMIYTAEYEAAPHHSPDEGGDGDPK